MLRPRFFTTQALCDNVSLTLEKEPSRHIARALRMRVDDRLCLFDGSGQETIAVITAIERDHVSVQTQAVQLLDRESPLRIILAVAISRGDRMDTTVQKATELGVDEVWPLLSERTGVRLTEERLNKKQQHWQRIAISACEQSGRNRIPRITNCASYAQVIDRAAATDADARLVLHPTADDHQLPETCASLILLIGPEGGFSDAEIELAVDAGFQALQLGPRVLRTETAPLTAIAVAQTRWGDLAR